MEGDDEILFSGSFKGFSEGIRFEMKGKSETDAAYALSVISARIEQAAFGFSGIDCSKVEKTVSLSGKGLASIISFLSSKKPNELRAELLAACPKPELIAVAECYFFNQVFENAGVPYKLSPSMFPNQPKEQKEKPEDQFLLLAKYKNWIAIKKLSVDPKTADYEISGILSGINNTIIAKSFDFVNATGIPIPTGGKKSYGNVVEALKKFVPSGNAFNDAFVINKTMEALYRPYAYPDMLTAAYPDIKKVKLKGRKPKG